jgi:hypothetical protein
VPTLEPVAAGELPRPRMIDVLPKRWIEDASLLRRYSAIAQAEVLEICATQLEAELREHELEALTLEEAVEESGYSYSALQKKVAAGELENVGKKGHPRIPRWQLPKKGGRRESGIADQIIASRLRRAS